MYSLPPSDKNRKRQSPEIYSGYKSTKVFSKSKNVNPASVAPWVANTLESGIPVGSQRLQLQYSKYHTKGGHGFAAEDANAFADAIRGKKVIQSGIFNEANGPDRIVNGVKIQTKYYQTARQSINAAFDPDTGLYRYPGQVLEVPADQYAEAVKIMEQKIREGKVPGVKTPADAKKLVKRGELTYQQAKNLAKAGTIESLKFDVKTQAVVATYAFGLSALVSFAFALWSGKSPKEAFKEAIGAAVKVAGVSFVTGVLTAQILRTRTAAIGHVVIRSGLKQIYSTPLGKAFIENLAKASLGRSVYGAAAVNHVSKLLRNNAVTATISFVITSGPDFYRTVIEGSQSWCQLTKNLITNASGSAGGTVGGAVGAALGAPLGFIGVFAGGFIGALVGGIITSFGAKTIADELFGPDDAEIMLKLLQEKVLPKLAFDYLIFEKEMNEKVLPRLEKRITADFLREMFKRYNKYGESEAMSYAYRELSDIFADVLKQRLKITNEDLNRGLQGFLG